MSGALLAHECLYDGTLSDPGTAFDSDLPLDNALIPRLSTVTRTTNATGTKVIRRTYTAAVTLQVFALVRSNLQKDATWRIRGYSDSGFTTLVYDSGSLAAWPEQWPVGVLQPGSPNYSDRKFTNAQIADAKYDVLHIADTAQTARYWQIDIADATNTDGYLEIAFLVMAPGHRPGGVNVGGNVANGAELGFFSMSSAEEALSGVRLVDNQPIARTMTLAFPATRLGESVAVLHRMIRTLGLSGLVYVVFDDSDVELLQARSFLAQLTELSPLQLVQYGQQTVVLSLREVLK